MGMGKMSLADNFMIYQLSPTVVDDGYFQLVSWIPVLDAVRAYCICIAGSLDADLNFELQRATSAAGAGATKITGAEIVTVAHATGDDKSYVIDFDFDHWDGDDTFTHWSPVITCGDGAVGDSVACTVLVQLRHRPKDQPATVGQLVTVAG